MYLAAFGNKSGIWKHKISLSSRDSVPLNRSGFKKLRGTPLSKIFRNTPPVGEAACHWGKRGPKNFTASFQNILFTLLGFCCPFGLSDCFGGFKVFVLASIPDFPCRSLGDTQYILGWVGAALT